MLPASLPIGDPAVASVPHSIVSGYMGLGFVCGNGSHLPLVATVRPSWRIRLHLCSCSRCHRGPSHG